jgi:cell division protein DivIC
MAKPPLRARNSKIRAIVQHLNRKKRSKFILILLVFFILLTYFATGQRGTIQLISFIKQKHDLEKEIRQLESEKKILATEKEKIEKDPEYIEKIAREKYKMKKKDEKVYQIVEDE